MRPTGNAPVDPSKTRSKPARHQHFEVSEIVEAEPTRDARPTPERDDLEPDAMERPIPAHSPTHQSQQQSRSQPPPRPLSPALEGLRSRSMSPEQTSLLRLEHLFHPPRTRTSTAPATFSNASPKRYHLLIRQEPETARSRGFTTENVSGPGIDPCVIIQLGTLKTNGEVDTSLAALGDVTGMVVHATLVSEEGKDDLAYVVVPPTMPSILAGLPPKSEPRKSWEESEPSSSDIVGAMILASIALRETLHQDPQSLELSRPDWNASRNLPNSLGLWPPDVSQQPPDRVAHEPLGQRHGTLSLDRRGTTSPRHGLGETHGDKFLVDGERKNRNPDRPWLISLQEAPIRSSVSQSADKPVVSMPSDISTKSTAGRPNPVASENVGSLTSSRVTSSMSWLNESDPELPRRSSGQTFPSNPRPAREDLTQDSWERVLMGSMVSSCHYLCDLNGLKGAYFVFPDLSLRVEGIFRLRMSLYNLARFLLALYPCS
ncbi:velvet factor-domain-containing protein [Powellomyces hirtus]|nr:velvet factor-domain-containing protein [Powellomyces hirtus]